MDRSHYISGVTVIAVPFLDQAEGMTHSLVSIGISEKIETVGAAVVAGEMMRIRDEVAALLVTGRAKAPNTSAQPRKPK